MGDATVSRRPAITEREPMQRRLAFAGLAALVIAGLAVCLLSTRSTSTTSRAAPDRPPPRGAGEPTAPGAASVTVERRETTRAATDTLGAITLEGIATLDGSAPGRPIPLEMRTCSYELSDSGTGPLNLGETLRSTDTDSAGRFRFRAVAPGLVAIDCPLPEISAVPIALVSVQAESPGQTTVSLRRAYSITGMVVDRSGSPVAGAQVSAGTAEVEMLGVEGAPSRVACLPGKTRSDERGVFTLPPMVGPLSMTAAKEGVGDAILQHVEVPPAEPVRIVLCEAREVVIEARDVGTGEPIPGATVWVGFMNVGVNRHPVLPQTTDATGRVSATVRHSYFFATAVKPGYSSESVHVRPDSDDPRFVRVWMAPSECSAIVVVDARTHAPVIGAEVRYLLAELGAGDREYEEQIDLADLPPDFTPPGTTPGLAITDGLGRVEIPHDPTRHAASVDVRVRAPGYAERFETITPGTSGGLAVFFMAPAAQLTLRMAEPSWVSDDTRIHVRNPHGLADLTIEFRDGRPRRADSLHPWWGPRITGETREVRITGLPAGWNYRVVCLSPGLALPPFWLLPGGDHVVVLDPTSAATLVFNVELAAGLEASVTLRHLRGGSAAAVDLCLNQELRIAGPGLHRLPGVPVGVFEVVVSSAGDSGRPPTTWTSDPIEIRGGGEIHVGALRRDG